MSREQYQVPNTSSFGAGSQVMYDQAGPTVTYLCGDCAAKVPLKKGDPIRCKECGHRILYKERTKRMVQFEAR
ncbi:MAG: DNA-directed RNA polymerase core subunit rpc10 [Cirrosporium novae-zelandiae]|nr:MAG: DNA-directed RNA polymerase core subunit rpc10 [Cirrosporium novae-zelandiae]